MIQSQDVLKRTEWAVALLLSALAISLLIVRATHAGALWRDECAVVQLAAMPSASDILHNFQHEAFPPLFALIVRAYVAIFGSSDSALRIFGLSIGCLVLVAFWTNARLLGCDVPLVALALTALNTTFFVWGTTIRGYGLGSALIVLTFGLFGSLLLAVDRNRIIMAALVACFGVQLLLYNIVLLIAIGGAAMAILLLRKDLKSAIGVAAICSTALISVLPYVPAYLHARDWNILVRGWPTSYSLWKHFEVALGNPGYSVPALWYTVAVGLTGVLLFRLYRNRAGAVAREMQLFWFAALAAILGLIGCYSFLRLLSYTTSNWYYLAFICVVASGLDLIASILCRSNWLRWCRLGVATAVLLMASAADWSAITERQTNLDLAARAVAERAAPTDLVLVVPWQFGIPFNRYYVGVAPWKTIPNIDDHLVHRYDLIKRKMLSQNPIDDLTAAVTATLASGNRVWFVGGLNLPPVEEGPMALPPAPASRFKWDSRAYTAAWWQQLSVLAVTHGHTTDFVPLPQPESMRINDLEQASVAVVKGR